MEATLLKTVGQIAGIGGIALGVFLLLFRDIIRKEIFPQLTKERAFHLIRLVAVLVSLIALAGIVAWVWVETRPAPPPPSTTVTAIGGVAAGKDVTAGKIEIHGTPPSTVPPAGGVTAVGGVATGDNVKADEIKINGQ
jgi:multidrug efflux pump subunit AcrA (membrane-fusion protein)